MSLIRLRDVSHFQPVPDWAALSKAEHLSGASAKATQGAGFIDPRFKANWAGMGKAPLIQVRIAYTYSVAGDSAKAHAELLLRQVDPGDGDMLCLDVERGPGATNQKLIRGWSEYLRKIVPGIPLVAYMGSGYAGSTAGKDLADYIDRWWFARYSGSLTSWPTKYSPVPTSGNLTGFDLPHIWQFSDRIKSKAKQAMDGDVSWMSAAALANISPPVPPPAKPIAPGANPMHASFSTITPITLQPGKIHHVGFETTVADPARWKQVGYHPTFCIGPVNADFYAAGTATGLTTGRVRLVEEDPKKAYAVVKAHPWHEIAGDRWEYSRPAAHFDSGLHVRLQIEGDQAGTLATAIAQLNYTKA